MAKPVGVGASRYMDMRQRTRDNAQFRTGEGYDAALQYGEQSAEDAAKNEADKNKWVKKGETVAADTAAGCTMGPWGCVGGAAVGLVQAFGGDVAAALNPPDFSEDDYTRIKNKCVNGYNGGPRGEVVDGIAPDQYGACRYADAAAAGGYVFSGGDAPFPGSWNVNWDADGKIVDQAAYDRWHQSPLCLDANGRSVLVPPGMICQPGTGAVVPPMLNAVTNISAHTRSVLLNAVHAAPKPAPMPNVTAKPLPMLGGLSVQPKISAAVLPPSTHPAVTDRIDATAHAIAGAAAAGNVLAKAAIGDIARKAKAGDTVAIAQAAILTQAAKLQIRAKYISKYGPGSAIYERFAQRVSTGAVPCSCHHN